MICWFLGHKRINFSIHATIHVQDALNQPLYRLDLCQRCRVVFWTAE